MPKKKGTRKSIKTILKGQEALQKCAEQGKTLQEVAKEQGVHRNTVASRIQTYLSSEQAQEILKKAREQLHGMIPHANDKFFHILKDVNDEDRTNALKAVQMLHRTHGLLKDAPLIDISNIIPIVVQSSDGTKTITIGPVQTSSEAVERVREPE